MKLAFRAHRIGCFGLKQAFRARRIGCFSRAGPLRRRACDARVDGAARSAPDTGEQLVRRLIVRVLRHQFPETPLAAMARARVSRLLCISICHAFIELQSSELVFNSI